MYKLYRENYKWKVNKPFLCSLAFKCQCKKMFCGPKVFAISHLTKIFFSSSLGCLVYCVQPCWKSSAHCYIQEKWNTSYG